MAGRGRGVVGRPRLALPDLFWLQGIVTAFFMTFFSFFNIPVFWPILVCYFLALFIMTMRRQIQ